MVAQLLALLDGLESRNGIFVLATTNRPKSIDTALRRPGRFDRVVWMKLPDENGRATILKHYLKPLRLDPGIDIGSLIADLAVATDGASGADLEYLCHTAARLCVKDALSHGAAPDEIRIVVHHFDLALSSLDYTADSVTKSQGLPETGPAASHTSTARNRSSRILLSPRGVP